LKVSLFVSPIPIARGTGCNWERIESGEKKIEFREGNLYAATGKELKGHLGVRGREYHVLGCNWERIERSIER